MSLKKRELFTTCAEKLSYMQVELHLWQGTYNMCHTKHNALLVVKTVKLRYRQHYSSIPAPKTNEHQSVNKEYKTPQRITWHIVWCDPPPPNKKRNKNNQSVYCLNNHVTVHIQSKVIIWSCGKNKSAVLIESNYQTLSVINLSLTRSRNPRLISKHWKC